MKKILILILTSSLFLSCGKELILTEEAPIITNIERNQTTATVHFEMPYGSELPTAGYEVIVNGIDTDLYVIQSPVQLTDLPYSDNPFLDLQVCVVIKSRYATAEYESLMHCK